MDKENYSGCREDDRRSEGERYKREDEVATLRLALAAAVCQSMANGATNERDHWPEIVAEYLTTRIRPGQTYENLIDAGIKHLISKDL
jgi:hypothetical protein